MGLNANVVSATEQRAVLTLTPSGANRDFEMTALRMNLTNSWTELRLAGDLIGKAVELSIYPVTRVRNACQHMGNHFQIVKIGEEFVRVNPSLLSKRGFAKRYFASFQHMSNLPNDKGQTPAEFAIQLTSEEYAFLNDPENIDHRYHVSLNETE